MKLYKMSYLIALIFMVFIAIFIVFLVFILEYQIFDKNPVVVENKGEYLEFYQTTKNPELIKSVVVELENKNHILNITSNQIIKDDLFSFKINLASLPQKYWSTNSFKGEIINTPIDFVNLIFEI